MKCVETKSPGELRKCVEKAPWQELWSSKGSAGLEAQAWKMGDLIRQAHSPSSLCDPCLPKPIKSLSPCETHPQGSMPRSQWCCVGGGSTGVNRIPTLPVTSHFLHVGHRLYSGPGPWKLWKKYAFSTSQDLTLISDKKKRFWMEIWIRFIMMSNNETLHWPSELQLWIR